MKIVVDEQIPWVLELFVNHGILIKKPSDAISAKDLKDADLLVVRSVNKINRELLENSSIKMVASATAGFDHVDVEWLHQQKIHFAYSPGCNANAVAEYVICCFAKLIKMNYLKMEQRVGVIGVGEVGSRVVEKLCALNFSVLMNDPPREKRDANFRGQALSTFTNLDAICVHTPLSTRGEFPTYHLLDQNFLQNLKNNAVILNAGRGDVIDEKALLENESAKMCLDVWANEPHINYDLAKRCTIATPHLAGYSIQAKFRATFQIYKAAQKFFGWPSNPFFPTFNRQIISATSWEDAVLQVLDPDKLRIQPRQFSANRKHYPFRNEFKFCDVVTTQMPNIDKEILKKLGFGDASRTAVLGTKT